MRPAWGRGEDQSREQDWFGLSREEGWGGVKPSTASSRGGGAAGVLPGTVALGWVEVAPVKRGTGGEVRRKRWVWGFADSCCGQLQGIVDVRKGEDKEANWPMKVCQ